MREPVRLRVHVSEPFDFERENGVTDLFGDTTDHHDSERDEWVIDLEGWFSFNRSEYDMLLVAPRYVGEHLSRVFDTFTGFPVRIAHRTSDGWHFAMTGMLSVQPAEPDEKKSDSDDKDY